MSDPTDKADHRPDVYQEDGTWVFRASSLGGCTRSLVLTALGEQGNRTKPTHVQKGMDEGTAAEATILSAARNHGWKPLPITAKDLSLAQYGEIDATGQLVVEFPVGAKAIVRLHPDGIAQKFRTQEPDAKWRDDDELQARRVMEAKALKNPPKTAAGIAGLHGYGWQFAAEMAGTGLPMLLLVGAKGDDGTVKVGDVTPYWIDEPPYTMGQIKGRVLRIVGMIERAKKEGVKGIPDCDVKQFPCPHFADWHDGQAIHLGKEKGDLVELVEGEGREVDWGEVTRFLNSLGAAQLDARDAKARIDHAKKRLKEILGDLPLPGEGDGPAAWEYMGWEFSRVTKHVEAKSYDMDYIDIRAKKAPADKKGK